MILQIHYLIIIIFPFSLSYFFLFRNLKVKLKNCHDLREHRKPCPSSIESAVEPELLFWGRDRGFQEFRDFGKEPFLGWKCESEINIFDRDVRKVLFCTMGTMKIAIIPGTFSGNPGIRDNPFLYFLKCKILQKKIRKY